MNVVEDQKHIASEELRRAEQMFSPFNWVHGELKDIRQEIGSLRQEIKSVEGSLRQEIKSVEGSLHQEIESVKGSINRLQLWVMATLLTVAISTIAAIVSVVTVLR